jgi:hypothetical protein
MGRKIFGISLYTSEKDIDVITEFLETISRLQWYQQEPWEYKVTSKHGKTWITLIEPYPEDEDEY